jgi:hypothetical protein
MTVMTMGVRSRAEIHLESQTVEWTRKRTGVRNRDLNVLRLGATRDVRGSDRILTGVRPTIAWPWIFWIDEPPQVSRPSATGGSRERYSLGVREAPGVIGRNGRTRRTSHPHSSWLGAYVHNFTSGLREL